MAVRAAALLALLGLVALVAAQGGNPATVGFATPPGFGTGEVNGWLNISPGQVLAVPISMVAGTSIRLSNFNMYVRHPNKADLNGAFWYGLYADVSGVPGGACLAPLRDTVLPYADGPDSRIVNDAINATFQTIAWTGNPVVFTAGARYWLCMASSLTLGIFANFAGTTPIMLAAADMSNPYPDLTGRTFPYFSVPNGGLTAASVDLFLTVLSNAPTLATGATSTATTATVAATVAGPVTVAATSAGPVTVAATTATVAGPATVATVGTTGAGAGTTSSATAPPGGTLPPGQAVLGFSDFPPAATASWIVVRAGTAMAVPVTASLAGATSASLLSFNLYVRHPNKLAVPGPFYIALYASDGGGNPIGAPLGQVSPASFPWGNVVSYAFNFTLQTFAPSAAVNIVPGAKYWLAVASSATDLNIYSDTSATGTTPMKLALSGGTLPTLAAGSSFWLNPSNGFTANTNMFIIVQSNAAALASVLTITTMSSAGTSTGPAPAAATTGPTTGPTTNGATLVGPTTGAATVATVATVAGPTTGGAATVAGTTAGTGGTLPPVTAAGTPIPTSTTGSTGSQTFTYGWVHTIGSVITFAPAPNGVAVNVTIPPQLGVAAYNFVGWEVEIQHPLRQDVTGSFSFALYDNDPTTGRPVGAPLATASSSVFAWSAQATWPTSQNATNQIVNAAQPKALLPTRTYWVYLGSSVPINVFAACPGDQQMFVAAPPAPNPAIASSFILFNRCNMALKIRVTTVVGPTSLTTGPPAGVTATTGSSTAASALAATSSTAATSAAVVAATSAATVASTSAVASLTSTASATGNTLPPTASSVAAVAATSAAAAAAATVSSVATSAAATAATSGASVTTGGPLPSGDASVGFSDPPTGTSIAWITIIKGQSLAIPVDLTLPGATTAVLKSFNAYVRHANQQAITGPFYFGLYASGTDGKPIGTPLGAVTVASFPFSGVVSAGANVTLQSFAAAAGANLTPGNKYWIAVAVDPTASASLNIISDINGPTLFLLAMTGGPLPNVAAGSNFWLSPSGFNTADTRMFITVGTDAVSLATGPTVSTFGSLASTTSTAAAAGAGGATTAAGPTTGQGVTVTSNGAGPTTNGGATITSGATNGGSSTTATTAASTTNAIASSTSTVSNSLTSATTTSVASTVTAAAASTSTTASTTAVTSTAFASGGATGTTTAASTTSTVATTTSTVAATTSASTSTTAATDAATTTSFSSTTAAAGNSNSGGSGKHRKGLPGWAVALIVIAVIIAVIIIVLLIVLIIVKGSSSGGYVDMDKQQSKKNAKEDYNIRV